MGSAPSILIVDDSPQDVIALRRAFSKAGVANPLSWVRTRDETINYLNGSAPYEDRMIFPLPSVILLALDMPNEDGFDVLTWIRDRYPNGGLLIVALTRAEEIHKVNRAYSLGANSFLTKPWNVDELQEMVEIFGGYWLLNSRRPAPLEFSTINVFSQNLYDAQ